MTTSFARTLKAWVQRSLNTDNCRTDRSGADITWEGDSHARVQEQSASIDTSRGSLPQGRVSAIFYPIGFHADGRPRGWLRFLLLKDKTRGTPRLIARRVLLANSGCIRPLFASWYQYYEDAPQNAAMGDYSRLIESCQPSLATAQTLHIVGTPHVAFVMDAIQSVLSGTRLRVTTSTQMPQTFTHDLYLIVTPHRFNRLPPAERLIQMQMEQVRASAWVTSSYINKLRDSIAIFDYAIDNVSALVDRGVPWKQIYFVPIRPAKLTRRTETRDIDVLFYGDISSPRRQRFLNALKEKFDVTIVSNIFGGELATLIERSKVVCNIHFYEDAILETTRISESLSRGARVVSEEGFDQANQGDFEKLVDFVPANDIPQFLQAVERNLRDWRGPRSAPDDQGVSGLRYHVLRALNSIGVLSFEELRDATQALELPSERLVLALPEHPRRYAHARSQCLPGAVPIHGLRHPKGWKGCANSYRLIASLAKIKPYDKLLIYEDDALFDADVLSRLSAVERYLDEHAGEWDIYSGLISDLSRDATIVAITDVHGERFFHLNSISGTVFSIFSHKGLQLLSEFEFHGDDIRRHTIDRFLESRAPRCVTTQRPLVHHAETLESSIWPIGNVAYTRKIKTSQRRLDSAVSTFSNQEAGDRGSI